MSMKFSRIPRLHLRLDFLQFWQLGKPSSHFKCLSRHVKHPVLTRLGFDDAVLSGFGWEGASGSVIESGLFCNVCEVGVDLVDEARVMDCWSLTAASADAYGGVNRV